jgi:hypothetical protein
MSQSPTPPSAPSTAVLFGANKAIAAVTYEAPSHELGAIFHIPTAVEGSKTYYKALACKITITEAQRIEIIQLLGGVVPVQVEPKEGNA